MRVFPIANTLGGTRPEVKGGKHFWLPAGGYTPCNHACYCKLSLIGYNLMITAKHDNGGIMQDFIQIVKQEIDRTGMPLAEVARQAECGRPYLHRVLAGEQVPSLDWVERVARVLGIRLKFEQTGK